MSVDRRDIPNYALAGLALERLALGAALTRVDDLYGARRGRALSRKAR